MSLSNTIRFISSHPLNRGRQTEALSRFLGWQFCSRLAPGPILFPWIRGTSLLARLGETGITQNIYCGLQEFSAMAFVLHLLLPEDWFMDIGANAGAYSVLAGGACGASGLAVEPVPSTFRRLTMQLRVNALESRVKAINAGCSDHTGQLWFSTDHDTVNGVVQSDYPGPKAALPITTVDILAGDQTPLWMKIDVEGHDAEVLRGATAVLARPELLALVIEASPAGPTPVILAAAGFLPSAYDPFTRTLTQGNWQELKEWQTVIAVRNYDLVAQRLSGAKPFEVLGREI